jgi:Tfp pilus assembly ATPase PilU
MIHQRHRTVEVMGDSSRLTNDAAERENSSKKIQMLQSKRLQPQVAAANVELFSTGKISNNRFLRAAASAGDSRLCRVEAGGGA